MLRQTGQLMSVFLIPVNQSKQLWHHSTPEYIWHHLPKITKTCQTGYTNHYRHKIKIEHDIIDKPFKLDILNEIPPQVNEIPQHFIHEIKTNGCDVIGVNLFLPKLMKFLPKKKVNSVRPILLTNIQGSAFIRAKALSVAQNVPKWRQSVNKRSFSRGTLCTSKFKYLLGDALSWTPFLEKGPPKITEGGPFDPDWPISRINPVRLKGQVHG